ncbi:MAG: HD family phosphohydrolase [Chthoniobacterales bacterium]
MFSFFSRKKSKKVRLKGEKNPFINSIANSSWGRLLIFVAFAVGLTFLIFSGNTAEPLKTSLIALLIFGAALVQLRINQAEIFACNRRLILIFSVIFVHLAVVKYIMSHATQGGEILAQLAPLLIPYALAPLVLSVLLGGQLGLWGAFICSLWSSMLFGHIDSYILIVSLISGSVVVYVTQQVRRRGRLIRAGIYVAVTILLLAAVFGKIGPIHLPNIAATNWNLILWECMAAIGVGIGTAILVSGFIPALESIFGITTDISWLEMSDLNHPLLKRLSMEAPGTYHHSLAVANLAEAAAEKVGANPTICRVAAYFHDIGKLVKPNYFTENIPRGENPHDELTPTMSALIIIAHVKEGIDLAIKNHLNPRIVDAIREHHGTSLVSYFYNRALKQKEDAELGGKIMNLRPEDVPQVHEENYRYPGPRPRSKETAILSLADSVESASRSLEHPTPQKIEDLIEGIVSSRLADHQLDEAPLTLDEIRRIVASFRFTLQSMLHSRIAYPKKQDTEKKQKKSAPSDSQIVSVA